MLSPKAAIATTPMASIIGRASFSTFIERALAKTPAAAAVNMTAESVKSAPVVPPSDRTAAIATSCSAKTIRARKTATANRATSPRPSQRRLSSVVVRRV
ncbi:hypothetical protein [Sinorhizobium meliloti]|uniref:hypothetical protein n=1 Tax=Rhizobium meliloti TaxID=382 RepID=UPI001F479E0C|nr:hypothetical protein [Sinorhizobium meliloti]